MRKWCAFRMTVRHAFRRSSERIRNAVSNLLVVVQQYRLALLNVLEMRRSRLLESSSTWDEMDTWGSCLHSDLPVMSKMNQVLRWFSEKNSPGNISREINRENSTTANL